MPAPDISIVVCTQNRAAMLRGALTALVTFLLIAVGNIVSTLFLCGFGLCPDAPTGYVI